MLARGSPRAALIGRWRMALTLVTGAVLIGRLIRTSPYLLPTRLPGLVLYEQRQRLILVAAVASAAVFTKADRHRVDLPVRLMMFHRCQNEARAVTIATNDNIRSSS